MVRKRDPQGLAKVNVHRLIHQLQQLEEDGYGDAYVFVRDSRTGDEHDLDSLDTTGYGVVLFPKEEHEDSYL